MERVTHVERWKMNIKQVTISFYIISSLYTLSASFIWGINTLFLLDSGLDILEVFIANAIFAASMTIFEIPTGVFADTKGRRFSFLVSTIVLFLGTSGYVLTSIYNFGLASFAIFSVFLGLGFTFYSGAVEAWVVDELQAAGFKGKLDIMFSKGSTISGIAMIVGTISGGGLGYINLQIPYIARAVALLLLFLFALFFMKENGFKPMGKDVKFSIHLKRITKDSITLGWKQKTIKQFMIISFFQSIFIMWAFYASQPYLLDLLGSRDAVWVSGLIAAGLALAQIFGNSLVPIMVKKFKTRTSILLITAVTTGLLAIGIGLSTNFPVALICFFIFMAGLGLSGPIKQGYMHQLIPNEQRATILSFDSLIGNTGGMIGQPFLGFISKTFSIGLGYILGSITLFATLPSILAIKKTKNIEDLI